MTTDPTALDSVLAITARHLGCEPAEVRPDATFFDLGADSLLLVGMVRELERALAVPVAMRDLFDTADTPRRLAALIADRTATPAVPQAKAATSHPTATPPAAAVPARPPAHPVPTVTARPPAHPVPTVTPSATPAPQPAAHAAPVPVQAATPPVVVPQQTTPTAPPPAAADAGPGAAQLRLLARLTSLLADHGDRPLPWPERIRLLTELTDFIARQPASPAAVAPVTSPPAPTAVTEQPTPPPSRPGPGELDFSVYFFGDYPRDNPVTGKYDLIFDVTRFADRHGFHAAWLPERHFHSFGGLFPNPSVLAAALARETTDIRLHAGSVVLPLHHPIRVAEEWSVVDNLSGGRAGLCVASGWHPNDFAFHPERFGDHRALMYTQLEQVRTLWRGEPLPATSGTGEDIDVRLYPPPVQPMPPMYAAVVGNPDSYRLAAQHDLGIVTNLMTQSVDQLAERVAGYRQARAEAGLDPDAGRVVVLLHTYLGEDLDRVRREAFAPFCDYLKSSLGLLGQTANSLGMNIDVANTSDTDLQFLLERAYDRYIESRALIGTPRSCAPIVESLLDSGVDEIACFVDFGVDPDLVRASLPSVNALKDHFTGRTPRRDRRNPPAPIETTPAAPALPDGVVDIAPLSYAQERFWLVEQLFPESTTYNELKAVRLTGDLDVPALRTSLNQLAERHSALRTMIRDVDGEPVQVVLAAATVELIIDDDTGRDEPEAVAAAVAAECDYVFDLANGPLFRARLLRLAANEHVLVLNAHHVTIDTVSAYVIGRELSELYRAQVSGEPANLPKPRMSYADYARDQRARVADPATLRDLDYWLDVLSGDLPVLELPTDRPRPDVLDHTGAAATGYLSPDLSRRARDYSAQRRTTLFMTLLTALSATLRQLTGQHDLVYGIAVADRPEGAEDLVGALLNTLPMRVDLADDPAFSALLGRVRDTVMDAFQHSGVPFERILEKVNPVRDTSRAPLFQVMVVYENEDVFDFDLPGITAVTLDDGPNRAIFDLAIYLTNLPQGVRIRAEYSPALFDEATILRYIAVFERVLDEALSQPDAPVSRLDPLTEHDRGLLSRWQHGPAVPAPAPSLHRLVELAAAKQPDAVAVASAHERLTYAELDAAADALAARLADTGVGPGNVVAVRSPRCPGLVVAWLGVLKAGAAYLPLDPALPDERVRAMLADADAKVTIDVDGDDPADPAVIDVDRCGRTRVPGGAGSPPVSATGPGDLACVVYTSGSTGRPKGVMLEHRGLVNVCGWFADLTGLRPADRIAFTSALGFDACVMDVWAGLAAGATVVIPDEEDRLDTAALARWFTAEAVDVAFLTTALYEGVIAAADTAALTTRVIATGGSALRCPPPSGSPTRVLNVYGPTETSVIVCATEVTADTALPAPIGSPGANINLYVLDERLRQVPVGITGELYIGGAGVSRGYLGQPDATAERFVTGVACAPDDRLYRTGDLVHWNPDGRLVFTGRNDDQVKIRGYRIEPGEVTQVLRELPGVADGVVIAQPAADGGDPQLAAYVVPDGEGDHRGLMDALARRLPDFMVPRRFAFLPRLPLNRNGKLDRRSLPVAELPGVRATTPRTEREKTLHDLWCAELGREAVDISVSYFDLGGDSLSATRLLNRIRSAMDVEYPLLAFFSAPTIAAMAERLTPTEPAAEVHRTESGRVRGAV